MGWEQTKIISKAREKLAIAADHFPIGRLASALQMVYSPPEKSRHYAR